MNRRELVAELAERLEIDKRTADAGLQAFVDIVTDTVSSGEVVAISGFAKFARVDRAARMGRNPQTGEAIRIKASRRVRVTPLKAFKDAVLTGKRPAKKAPAKKTVAKKAAPAKKAVAKKAARQEGGTGEEGSGEEDGRPQGARQEDRGEEDHPPLGRTQHDTWCGGGRHGSSPTTSVRLEGCAAGSSSSLFARRRPRRRHRRRDRHRGRSRRTTPPALPPRSPAPTSPTSPHPPRCRAVRDQLGRDHDVRGDVTAALGIALVLTLSGGWWLARERAARALHRRPRTTRRTRAPPMVTATVHF